MDMPLDDVGFLQWALPRLGFRWAGFRKVRGQVIKRLHRRLKVLGLADLAAYRERLGRDDHEWQVLDAYCRITISRFYRDRGVFGHLRSESLPALCRRLAKAGERHLRALSLGCCGDEEPYTLSLIWSFDLAPRFPELSVEIVATDSDPNSLSRAARACYSPGCVKDLPPHWRATAFERRDELFCLRHAFRQRVTFLEQDLRGGLPCGPFHLVLCRNLVFTYFDDAGQRQAVSDLAARLCPGGILVLGKHERLPTGSKGFKAVSAHLAIYRRT